MTRKYSSSVVAHVKDGIRLQNYIVGWLQKGQTVEYQKDAEDYLRRQKEKQKDDE